MSSRLQVELYQARNKEWSFRVIRGARITLVAGETYKVRGGARRALRSLATVCTDSSSSSWVSPLQAACLKELADEQRRWDARKR